MQLLCNQAKAHGDLLSFLPEDDSTDENFAKIERVFEKNKTAVLNLLQQKKSLLSTATFQELIKSVNTVVLGSFNDAATRKLFYGACNHPNAIYIRSMHRILVCPALGKFPELTLYQTLAHELGHVVQKLQNAIHCFQRYPKRQIEEAFADWVASKIVSEKINQEKDRTLAKKNAVESQLLFLSLACEKTTKINPDWARSHPSLQSRVEKIFLAQPALQDALHCESKTTKSCG